MLRKWDIKNKQERERCVYEIIARVAEEDDTDIGVIAAQEILDIVAEHLGPECYNMGIEEARKLTHARFADLEVDLDVAKAPI